MKRITVVSAAAAMAMLWASASVVSAQGTSSGGPAAAAKPTQSAPVSRPSSDASPPPRAVPIYTKDKRPATPKLEDLPLKESVSQYGITWTFDKPSRVGQFVTGDWYVVGPVTVKAIDPAPADGVHGSMLNPQPGEYQGYAARNGVQDGKKDRIYKAELTTVPPVAIKLGDSLVSTITLASGKSGRSHRLYGRHVGGGPDSVSRAAAVLTCLEKPVPPDTFRPGYCGRTTKVFRASDLCLDLLPSVELTLGAPDIEGFARVFQRPWIDHAYSWSSRHIRPVENMPEYGQQVGHAVEEGGLLLLSNAPIEKKMPLLIGFIQVGIDNYGCVERGLKGWPGAGGFGNGRKWPIVFAGVLLQDKEMQNVKAEFGEDDHTAFGTCWTGAGVVFTGQYPRIYQENPKGYPDRGPFEHLPPDQWYAVMGEAYRRANTSICWVGQAMAARLMRAEKTWNHDAFFAYVDRWMYEEDGKSRLEIDKVCPNLKLADEARIYGRQGHCLTFVKEMWEKYRTAPGMPPTDGWKRTANTPPAPASAPSKKMREEKPKGEKPKEAVPDGEMPGA